MNKSESIKELAAALVKVQGEISNPSNSKTVGAGSYSYNYAPLDEILNHIRPILSKNGLSIIQTPITYDGMVGVVTMLMHETGEYIESDPIMLKLDKQSAQGAGSAITYARRYSLSAVLGIASEDDDDANRAEPKGNGSSRENSSGKVENLKCSECSRDITKSMRDVSINNFGRELCPPCQKNEEINK